MTGLADVHIPDPGFGPQDDLRHWPAAPAAACGTPCSGK
jgi:hypothetical protein